MAAKKQLDPVNAAVASLVASDDDLQNRLRRIVNAALADAEYVLRYGSPQERAAIMKSMVPAMMRSLSAVEDKGADDGEEAAYERMMSALRGE